MFIASPLTPAQEAQRLQALQPYKGLMHSKNPVFSQLVKLTARLFAMPISLLSLVDAETVAYPGQQGILGLPDELPRQQCICAVAIFQPDKATVFTNLREQPCQWVEPESQANFDFYASFPLVTSEGHQPIGALCVLDRQARSFSTQEQMILKHMATIAMRLLDLELLAPPTVAPALWAAIESRVQLSLQRIDTLTALSRWEESPRTPTAQSYQNSLHDERSLIVQDIDYQVNTAFSRLRQRA